VTTVRNLLKKKGAEIFSIPPHATVFEAVQLMIQHNIGALLVMQQGQVAGILSERDLTRKVLGAEKSPRAVHVHEVMTPAVVFAYPEFTLEACLAIMTQKRVRHLPVLTHARQPLGMISLGDLGKEITGAQAEEIQRLENLVTGIDYGN
jgi:CBS domain-containing protein